MCGLDFEPRNEFCVRLAWRSKPTMSSLFEEIISLPNLFAAWREFIKGKNKKGDVLEFAADLEEHIFLLHDDLANGKYRHGGYTTFIVSDPKPRRIHKACVRDRLLHHAVARVLCPYFDGRFIFDSYSSRKGKGTHAAIKRFRDFAWRISRNRTRTVWILKMDVRKYFASIDHNILFSLFEKSFFGDGRLRDLLWEIINSFHAEKGKGIPLGNLTSQLFSNIYLNPLDQFVKRRLWAGQYIRYADDIFILSHNRNCLANTLARMERFLEGVLALRLHPAKIHIMQWHRGVDILGFVSSPTKTILRTKTRRRMIKRLVEASDFDEQYEALYSRMKYER